MQQNGLPPAPFVNGELLPRYAQTNSPVRIIGCLIDENASEVTIRTSDNMSVTVIRQHGGQPYGRSEVVEVMGLVTGPNCINEIGHVDIVQPQGKEFNMANYDKMVHFAASQTGVFT